MMIRESSLGYSCRRLKRSMRPIAKSRHLTGALDLDLKMMPGATPAVRYLYVRMKSQQFSWLDFLKI